MNNNSNNPWDAWDAQTYDRISIDVQLEWGRRLIEKRQWVGNEIVMDAGAGSGNLTKFLANTVTNGKVYAVDADPNMIEQAKSNLSGYKNVQIINSSMENVDLPTKVDVIFSNSAIHWILDQDRLFSRFWHLLKPYDGGGGGGELLIECGGHGNIERAISIIMKISQSDQFKEHFIDWKQSWYFPKPDETERMLHRAKFREIQVNLSKLTTTFSDRESFANFMKTIMNKPFLGYLPDAKKKGHFLGIFLKEFERLVGTWSLDFTRLRIFAQK